MGVAGSKVLVTGGAGFIGSHLVRRLLEMDCRVVVLDNLSRNVNNIQDLIESKSIEFVKGDIREKSHVDLAMTGVDEVLHLAAICINRCKAFPKEAIDVNLNGSYNVFGSAIGNSVKRVLSFSTASVFGEPAYLPMDEHLPRWPEEPYGATKNCAEQMLRFLSRKHGLPYLIVRPFNVYGRYQSTDAYYTSVINVFIKRLLSGERPRIDGTGEQTMDFTHVDDIVGAVTTLLSSDIVNEDFNLAPGNEASIREIATKISQLLGVEREPEFVPRDVLVTRRRGDPSKLLRMTDFRFGVSLEEGLRDLVEHVRHNIDLY